jgi:hypothetical protein
LLLGIKSLDLDWYSAKLLDPDPESLNPDPQSIDGGKWIFFHETNFAFW